MKILSWDVGIYNLSYCILEKTDDSDKIKILDWDIVNLVDNDLMKKNRTLIFENIPRKLQEKPQLLNVYVVVIENQHSLKNPQMKSIQMILYSYFLILGKIVGNSDVDKNLSYIDKIDFCSASNKLKIYDGPAIILEEKPKRKNKNTDVPNVSNVSIDTVIISEPIENKKKTVKYADKKRLAIEHAKYFLKDSPEYVDFFNNHKKKDDLSDSFLQGLYYLSKNYLKSN